MLLLIATTIFAQDILIRDLEGFKSEDRAYSFKDLDHILKKNSAYYKTKPHTYPNNHQFTLDLKAIDRNDMFIDLKNDFEISDEISFENSRRYHSRGFDLFENKKDAIPNNHKALFYDSNPRYSQSKLQGATKLYSMEE